MQRAQACFRAIGGSIGISWIASIIAVSIAMPGLAQVSVLTQDYDNTRSGANLNETILNPSTVGRSTFGRLFSLAVDEEVFAQPLYVPNLSVNGGMHNVVFVTTNGNSVYAFDADDPAQAATPLWQSWLGPPIPSSRYFFTRDLPMSASSARQQSTQQQIHSMSQRRSGTPKLRPRPTCCTHWT